MTKLIDTTVILVAGSIVLTAALLAVGILFAGATVIVLGRKMTALVPRRDNLLN
jgi:hypothetical protein